MERRTGYEKKNGLWKEKIVNTVTESEVLASPVKRKGRNCIIPDGLMTYDLGLRAILFLNSLFHQSFIDP